MSKNQLFIVKFVIVVLNIGWVDFIFASKSHSIEDSFSKSSMVCIAPHTTIIPTTKNSNLSYITATDLEFCYAVKYLHNYYKLAFGVKNWDTDINFINLRKLLASCYLVLYDEEEY